MVRLVRFGLDLFRYDAVLFDEVHRFRPVAAIRHAPQDVLHELALEERVGIFDDHFQEIVGLFQFIVKREVVLRQLELVKAASFITRYALRIHHHIRRAALWDGPYECWDARLAISMTVSQAFSRNGMGRYS